MSGNLLCASTFCLWVSIKFNSRQRVRYCSLRAISPELLPRNILCAVFNAILFRSCCSHSFFLIADRGARAVLYNSSLIVRRQFRAAKSFKLPRAQHLLFIISRTPPPGINVLQRGTFLVARTHSFASCRARLGDAAYFFLSAERQQGRNPDQN